MFPNLKNKDTSNCIHAYNKNIHTSHIYKHSLRNIYNTYSVCTCTAGNHPQVKRILKQFPVDLSNLCKIWQYADKLADSHNHYTNHGRAARHHIQLHGYIQMPHAIAGTAVHVYSTT